MEEVVAKAVVQVMEQVTRWKRKVQRKERPAKDRFRCRYHRSIEDIAGPAGSVFPADRASGDHLGILLLHRHFRRYLVRA